MFLTKLNRLRYVMYLANSNSFKCVFADFSIDLFSKICVPERGYFILSSQSPSPLAGAVDLFIYFLHTALCTTLAVSPSEIEGRHVTLFIRTWIHGKRTLFIPERFQFLNPHNIGKCVKRFLGSEARRMVSM